MNACDAFPVFDDHKEFVLLSQLKSVIKRTKEIPNVHPMYRDGLIRRKMGPVIFHKSNSQDRLIEELQGKLGIGRKERMKKQQSDDWLTEGVIVMSNPKRSREDHNREVDKVDRKEPFDEFSFHSVFCLTFSVITFLFLHCFFPCLFVCLICVFL